MGYSMAIRAIREFLQHLCRMRLSMGYPDRDAEKDLIAGQAGGNPLDEMTAAFTPAALVAARRRAQAVHMDESLLDYLLRIVEGTRAHPDLALGASPRAALALGRAARAAAHLAGRDFVVPDDIKSLAEPVLAHRLSPREGSADPASRRDQVRAVLGDVLERAGVPL